MVSKIALINAKMRILRKANKVLSKHRRVKEQQICSKQVLTIENTTNLISQKDVVEQVQGDKRVSEELQHRRLLKEKQYSIYSKTDYNVRTCKVTASIYSGSDKEIVQQIQIFQL